MPVVKKIAKILTVISVFILVFSYFQKSKLPNSNEIVDPLYQEPIQKEINLAPFDVSKGTLTYNIIPLYGYAITGLVVADYDSENWFDYIHKYDRLNTKDLCIIWNNNLKNDAFKKINYSHGEFTCYYRYSGADSALVQKYFSPDELSNNHLLPANDEIYKKIKESSVGDQVKIEGYLANYSYIPEEKGDNNRWTRNTSVTRTDTGNGACEIIYVTNFEILKKDNFLFHKLFKFSFYSLTGLMVFLIIAFFLPEKQKPFQPVIKPSSSSRTGLKKY